MLIYSSFILIGDNLISSLSWRMSSSLSWSIGHLLWVEGAYSLLFPCLISWNQYITLVCNHYYQQREQVLPKETHWGKYTLCLTIVVATFSIPSIMMYPFYMDLWRFGKLEVPNQYKIQYLFSEVILGHLKIHYSILVVVENLHFLGFYISLYIMHELHTTKNPFETFV